MKYNAAITKIEARQHVLIKTGKIYLCFFNQGFCGFLVNRTDLTHSTCMFVHAWKEYSRSTQKKLNSDYILSSTSVIPLSMVEFVFF